VEKGDEIHSTKIYHVYNQSPEMLAQGQQLVSELEELAGGGSRRSTLRRHYTPGDYLKYEEGGGAEYNSLGRGTRRSMSASALGRGLCQRSWAGMGLAALISSNLLPFPYRYFCSAD
jgi:hypothetical protein